MKIAHYVIGLMAMVVAVNIFIDGCGRQESGEAEKIVSEPAVTQAAGIVQKTCPIMGGAINKNIYVDYNGRRVYFCCKMCVATFKKDPQKYVTKVDAEIKKLQK